MYLSHIVAVGGLEPPTSPSPGVISLSAECALPTELHGFRFVHSPPFGRSCIELHTRPSPCLSVSALMVTFACHAFCVNKSNIDVIAVSRMVAPISSSLLVLVPSVAFSTQLIDKGLYDMLSNCGRRGIRTPGAFYRSPR